MAVIVLETEAFKKLWQEMLEEQRLFLNAWAASYVSRNSEKTVWLSPLEARNRLHVKSRKKMQEIRSTGEIHYKKNGREYLYDEASLDAYMDNHSTKKYSIMNSKKNKPKIK